MPASPKSWIRSEEERPLCLLRKGLQGIIDSFEYGQAEPNEINNKIESLWLDLESKTPGAFRAEKSEALKAIQWLQSPNTKKEVNEKKEDSNQILRISEPSYQAVWGFALLMNKKLKEPKNEEEVLKGNTRLIQEKNLMGSLLLGTIQNRSTTICWGKSGSWFYHDPRANHINMDPGQALLLGLQNSRGVLLHEIGHSQITKSRSPKLEAIQKEIEDLCEKGPRGIKLVPKDPEKRKKIARLAREASFRETFWQYAEDACVNTYAEIEGLNFTNDIQTALMRVYAVTLLGREAKKAQEEAAKSLVGKSNPLKELEKIIKGSKGSKGGMTTKDPIEEKLEEKLKAAGAAYPISRGWMNLDDQKDWDLIGSKNTPENIELINSLSQDISKVSDPSLSISPSNPSIEPIEPIASMQPSLTAKRFELISQDSLVRITNECAQKRNQTIDELFDSHFLPLIDKLPEPPELPTQEIEIEGSSDGEEQKENQKGNPKGNPSPGKGQPQDQEEKDKDKEGKQDGSDPKGGKEKEDNNNGKGGKGKEPDYEDIINGEDKKEKPSEGQIDNTVEDKASTLEEASKKNQEDKEKADADEKKRAQNQQQAYTEAIKNSMGQRSPLDELPEGCGNYEEAVQACQPQIGIIVSILKKIALKQKVKSPGSRNLLPDPLLGAQSFELESYLERKKKEESKELLTMDDRKHFIHEERKKLEPSTTHLAFYIDGSGSMGGRPAEKTMMTLVIFNEASKRVPEIQISAVYSGAGKTRLLLDGGEVCKGEEKLIGDILSAGYASGDNEISAGGLSEMTETIAKSIPRRGNFGCTHTIFLTDGGSCPSDKNDIAKAISTSLDLNPLATFDTLIVDGSKNSNFHQCIALVKPKRKNQDTTIKECEKVSEICPTIAHTLLQRIREFKSFSPKTSISTKKTFKKLSHALREQEDTIMGVK